MTARANELEAVYVRLEKPVFNVVYRWLWNAEEARDVTQEAFLKVWQAKERVDLSTVEPLVFRTALNLAANRLRARKLWGFLTLEPLREHADEKATPDEELDVERRRAQVRRAVDALPEKLKRVVVMCELSGLSYAQVAQALDIPAGTVGSRRNLALAALEKSLGPLEDA
jgi:RNA polymerase sigma-70 factor (ECF subfamily)